MSYLRSIKKKILNLSSQAGIYQFLNYKGDILYIGKEYQAIQVYQGCLTEFKEWFHK